MLLANLFRDQLDRYGELETIGDRWLAAVGTLPPASALVLNADDPLVADLGRDRAGVLYFGVDDDTLARPEMQHAADSKHCRRCGTPYVYDAIYLGHLGHYHCPTAARGGPSPTVRATEVELGGIRAAPFTLVTPEGAARVGCRCPGLYNVYNAVAAAALCVARRVGGGDRGRAGGRRAGLRPGGDAAAARPGTSLLLVKNPAGANEVLRTLTLEPDGLDVLGVLNDRIADGRDVSWVWDADWELIAARPVAHGLLRHARGRAGRAAEVRGRAARAERPSSRSSSRRSTRRWRGAGPLYVLPTYTALIELRELLTRRGEARDYWR